MDGEKMEKLNLVGIVGTNAEKINKPHAVKIYVKALCNPSRADFNWG